jgi:hypothetical protein
MRTRQCRRRRKACRVSVRWLHLRPCCSRTGRLSPMRVTGLWTSTNRRACHRMSHPTKGSRNCCGWAASLQHCRRSSLPQRRKSCRSMCRAQRISLSRCSRVARLSTMRQPRLQRIRQQRLHRQRLRYLHRLQRQCLRRQRLRLPQCLRHSLLRQHRLDQCIRHQPAVPPSTPPEPTTFPPADPQPQPPIHLQRLQSFDSPRLLRRHHWVRRSVSHYPIHLQAFLRRLRFRRRTSSIQDGFLRELVRCLHHLGRR